MRIDLRVKHDVETRRLAAELFADGLGYAAAAKRLSVPKAAVRKWQQIYRAFGSEVLLTMDGKQARYTYEQKVAAARAGPRRSGPSRRAGPRARRPSRASSPASRSSRSAAAGSRRRSPT